MSANKQRPDSKIGLIALGTMFIAGAALTVGGGLYMFPSIDYVRIASRNYERQMERVNALDPEASSLDDSAYLFDMVKINADEYRHAKRLLTRSVTALGSGLTILFLATVFTVVRRIASRRSGRSQRAKPLAVGESSPYI